MFLACCFRGDGVDVKAQQKLGDCKAPAEQVTAANPGEGQESNVLQSGGTTKTGTTYVTENTAFLSADTSTDFSAAYQLNILSSSLAGISGNWYERLSSAASRLTSVSGAAVCSVSILGCGHDHFTVVHVTGMDPECLMICPIGSQLPALQGMSSVPVANSGPERRYNSMQVLQMLQTPLLYSFTDPVRGSCEMKQAPCDWQAVYESRRLSDFCALPLLHEKSVIGAVTLICAAPPPQQQQRPPPLPLTAGQQSHQHGLGQIDTTWLLQGAGLAARLMYCDEQSMRTLGLLLSVLLVGPDLQLAQQVGDILAGVHSARNLQQTITSIVLGTARVLQLQTHVPTAVHLALLPGAEGGSSGGGSGAGGAAGPGMTNGRAIFFEERAGHSAAGGGLGGNGGRVSRLGPEVAEPHVGSGSVGQAPRSTTQRASSPMEATGCGAGGGGAAGASSTGPQQHTPSPLGRVQGTAAAGPVPRSPGAGLSASCEAAASEPKSAAGALLWQASLVQARALSLRHTLLAYLPSGGTVVHDCASYMQQAGSPKRDLYLLSASKGTPPFSLVIAPALLPLRDEAIASCGAGASAQLVLYAAVAIRLPQELLNEILAQAQQLALRVLAPLLAHKLTQSGLAEEWALLVEKCFVKRVGAGSAAEQGEMEGADSAAPGVLEAAARGGDAAVVDDSGGGGSAGSSGHRRGARTAATAAAAAQPTDATSGGGNAREQQVAAAQPPPASSDAPAAVAAATAKATAAAGTSAGVGGGDVFKTDDGGTMTSALAASCDSQATVLSTAIVGAFAGDTRTHLAMLVASFKETINALQMLRADESEELSVLKLGKVLGRGGSGLVFQGYLHMGLEVAVKLFENPDDTDPDAVSSSERTTPVTPEGGSSRGGEVTAAAAAAAGSGDGGGSAASGAARDSQPAPPAKPAAALTTKRQRNLLRNALELGITSSLSHPNIVQGYCHWVNVVLMQDASLNRCWLMGQAEYTALAPPGSPPPPLCSALVMEYCDMGSLIHALRRGAFALPDGKSNMEFVYMCLLEIALALRHLHTAKLAHCDLKPGNVLLRSSPRDLRGFVCKLGDFGYAAILKDGLIPGRPAVLPDEACGTLQYMAPELFVAGRPVDASIDVYAFGMLMWELITGRTPYSEGDYPSRSLMKAVYHGKRPAFPDTTLSAYKNLAKCCWSGDPTLRPSATVLVKLLRQQLEASKQQTSTAGSSSTGGHRG